MIMQAERALPDPDRMERWMSTLEAVVQVPICSRAEAEVMFALAERYLDAYCAGNYCEVDAVVLELDVLIASASDGTEGGVA
jgi:hypothetical protein